MLAGPTNSLGQSLPSSQANAMISRATTTTTTAGERQLGSKTIVGALAAHIKLVRLQTTTTVHQNCRFPYIQTSSNKLVPARFKSIGSTISLEPTLKNLLTTYGSYKLKHLRYSRFEFTPSEMRLDKRQHSLVSFLLVFSFD